MWRTDCEALGILSRTSVTSDANHAVGGREDRAALDRHATITSPKEYRLDRTLKLPGIDREEHNETLLPSRPRNMYSSPENGSADK